MAGYEMQCGKLGGRRPSHRRAELALGGVEVGDSSDEGRPQNYREEGT